MEISSLVFPYSHSACITLSVCVSVTVLVWLGPVGGEVRFPPLPECIYLHVGLWCCRVELGCAPHLTHKFTQDWRRGSQVTDHVWWNKFPNETKLYWKKKSSERKFTWAGWPIPGSWKDVLARLEEVNAKENGQRSVGVTKKQCGHERESSFSRASPDHHLDLSTSCLLYQVKAKQVWMSPASMDPCWSPLLVDGHRQAKRELTDRQV